MDWRRLPATVALAGAFVFTVLAQPMGGAAYAASAQLFHDVPAPTGVGVVTAFKAGAFAVQSRYVTLDLSALQETRTQLDMFPGKYQGSLTAVWDRVEVTSPDTYAWIGKVDGVDLSDVSLVVNVVKGIAVGSISTPGGLYRIRYAGQGVHAIEELDPGAFPDDEVIEVDVPHGDSAAADTAADTALVIDVMVLYTAAARTAAGGATAMNNLIDLAITQTNQGYANSGVHQRLRLVRKQEVSYTESTSTDAFVVFDAALDWVTGNATIAGLRNTYGADLVALLIHDDGGVCGFAHLPGTMSTAAAPFGFSVTRQDCAVDNLSFAHELGHNMGARHDRYVDPSNGPYTYNHGYVAPDYTWRTIMAYNDRCVDLGGVSCTRLNRWSNPNLKYNGVAMGIAEGSASSADNRKTLNTSAPSVANFRTEVNACPTPTISPTSRSATTGGGSNTVAVNGTVGCPWGAISNATWITVTSNATGTGDLNVGYSVAPNTGAQRTGTITIASRTFTVTQAAATACGTSSNPCPLTSGTAKTGLSGASNSMKYYSISVPANATKLVVQTSAGSGNVDVYVRRGSVPTTTTYTCRNIGTGTAETCTVNNPPSGTWYVMLHGPGASYSSVTLKATVTACSTNTAPGCPLSDNVTKSSLSGNTGTNRYYYIDVPTGRTSLTVTTSGGTGDMDLYVRFNAAPTTSTFTCRPFLTGNNETCTISNPSAGRWYIMLNGYAAYSGMSLNANFAP